MSESYPFQAIEARQQKFWETDKTFQASPYSTRPKFYALEFFPYPSGAGLSVGHGRNYIPGDAHCRYRSMRGFNVLHPMGWDAFGQPAENEAIRCQRHPREMVREYAGNYRNTFRKMGCGYDWSREFFSSDPEYYRWTQWFFLLLFQRGLAYRAVTPIHWCPSCRTGLANEEVKEARCWRCDTVVESRPLPQWFFRITAYAERLLADLDPLDWPEGIKQMQRDWIRGSNPEQQKFHLRDWLISRQRFWGAPIPVIHCEKCGTVAVPENQLPVTLPEVVSYSPMADGRSPLASIAEFTDVVCPSCGQPAQRETDTMGGFACSSWYFLRFSDPANNQVFADRGLLDYWCPVDLYTGGAEHAVMHLLYARFWTKVLFDAGLIGFSEPFPKLRSQGTVLARTAGRRPRHAVPDEAEKTWIVLKPEERATFPEEEIVWRWVRMSKSKGNIVKPEEVIERYGADTLRVCLMFVAAFEDNVQWNEQAVAGAHRFLNRAWHWMQNVRYDPEWRRKLSDEPEGSGRKFRMDLHRAIVSVGQDLEDFGFNTAIATLMQLLNTMWETYPPGSSDHPADPGASEAAETFVLLLAPFAPHLADELWQRLGKTGSTYHASWPVHDPVLLEDDTLILPVQINGRVRVRLEVPAGISDDALKERVLQNETIQGYIAGRTVVRMVIAQKRLVNVVVGN